MKGGKMGCNCSLTEKIIGILVIVFAWWNPAGYSNWVLTILGALLIIHAFKCTACKMPASSMKKSMPASKKKKKR